MAATVIGDASQAARAQVRNLVFPPSRIHSPRSEKDEGPPCTPVTKEKVCTIHAFDEWPNPRPISRVGERMARKQSATSCKCCHGPQYTAPEHRLALSSPYHDA